MNVELPNRKTGPLSHPPITNMSLDSLSKLETDSRQQGWLRTPLTLHRVQCAVLSAQGQITAISGVVPTSRLHAGLVPRLLKRRPSAAKCLGNHRLCSLLPGAGTTVLQPWGVSYPLQNGRKVPKEKRGCSFPHTSLSFAGGTEPCPPPASSLTPEVLALAGVRGGGERRTDPCLQRLLS